MDKALLVSTPLIWPILRDIKTDTRRLNGLDRVNEFPDSWELISFEGNQAKFKKKDAEEFYHVGCRYGVPGDSLWVRENWFVMRHFDNVKPADLPTPVKSHLRYGYVANISPGERRPAWAGRIRPSIHMPRWLCRIRLLITGVRLERLHAITEDGAKLEGFPMKCIDEFSGFEFPARTWFMNTWINLNGQESWDANPWVWVISFKRKK